MRFLGICFAASVVSGAVNEYRASIPMEDKSFVAVALTEPYPAGLSSLTYHERGALDTMFSNLTALGRIARDEGAAARGEDNTIRKNLLNYFRVYTDQIVRVWCRPIGSQFCTAHIHPLALNFVESRFCMNLDRPMREATCMPAALANAIRARRGIPLPPGTF